MRKIKNITNVMKVLKTLQTGRYKQSYNANQPNAYLI
jgi:hypothetical protein